VKEDDRVVVPDGREGYIHLIAMDTTHAYVELDDGDYRIYALADLRLTNSS
jgi:hypothetical protein